ncbi:hypothetical protein ABH917_004114 [Thermobifida halotolerans]
MPKRRAPRNSHTLWQVFRYFSHRTAAPVGGGPSGLPIRREPTLPVQPIPALSGGWAADDLDRPERPRHRRGPQGTGAVTGTAAHGIRRARRS